MYELKQQQFAYYGRDGIARLTKPLVFRADTNDWNTLESAIHNDEYLLRRLPEPKMDDIFIDIGAHIGSWTVYVEALYPGFTTFAVEVLPQNVQLLRQNINGFIINLAIAEKSDEIIEMSYGDLPEGHHRYIANSTPPTDDLMRFSVKTISLNEILEPIHHVHILKIDCEGAEYNALKGAAPHNLDKIDYIIGEHHYFSPTLQGRKHLFEFVKMFFRDITLPEQNISDSPLGGFLFQNNKLTETF